MKFFDKLRKKFESDNNIPKSVKADKKKFDKACKEAKKHLEIVIELNEKYGDRYPAEEGFEGFEDSFTLYDPVDVSRAHDQL